MAPESKRKHRKRHFTPPPDLLHKGQLKHPQTPQRCDVFWAKAFSQVLGILIPQDKVREATGIPPRVQGRILRSNQIRTLHNEPDSGPDPRGKSRALKRSDTFAISNYLDDPTTSLQDKGQPWLDITEASAVDLPQTYHFKPPGLRTIEP